MCIRFIFISFSTKDHCFRRVIFMQLRTRRANSVPICVDKLRSLATNSSEKIGRWYSLRTESLRLERMRPRVGFPTVIFGVYPRKCSMRTLAKWPVSYQTSVDSCEPWFRDHRHTSRADYSPPLRSCTNTSRGK